MRGPKQTIKQLMGAARGSRSTCPIFKVDLEVKRSLRNGWLILWFYFGAQISIRSIEMRHEFALVSLVPFPIPGCSDATSDIEA